MSTGAYIGIGGTSRKIKNIYFGIGNVSRKVKKAYVGIGGVSKLWWKSVPKIDQGSTIYSGTQYNHSIPSTDQASLSSYAAFPFFNSSENKIGGIFVNKSGVVTEIQIAIEVSLTTREYGVVGASTSSSIFITTPARIRSTDQLGYTQTIQIYDNLTYHIYSENTKPYCTNSNIRSGILPAATISRGNKVEFINGSYFFGSGSSSTVSLIQEFSDNGTVRYVQISENGTTVCQFDDRFIVCNYVSNPPVSSSMYTNDCVKSSTVYIVPGRIAGRVETNTNKLYTLYYHNYSYYAGYVTKDGVTGNNLTYPSTKIRYYEEFSLDDYEIYLSTENTALSWVSINRNGVDEASGSLYTGCYKNDYLSVFSSSLYKHFRLSGGQVKILKFEL